MILYKRTSSGAIQQWSQEVEGSKFRTISGQVGGQLVVSEWRECVGKNLGKKNETTPEQQAILEVEANYRKKLSVDYYDNINDIDTPKSFLPMLALKYEKGKSYKGWFSQPKLDGMRCVITDKGMFSRKGKPIVSCPHIWESLKPLVEKYGILDGELYNHVFADDFNSLISILKKQKPTAEDLAQAKQFAQFHIYDIYMPGTYSERLKVIQSLSAEYLSIVPTEVVVDDNHLTTLYESYLADLYEGQMLRYDAEYQLNKRTKFLLKRKETDSEEFVILDVLPGVGNWANRAKKVVLRINEHIIGEAGVKGTREYTRDLLLNKDKYIGKLATCLFQGFTPDGKPRFARIKEMDRQDA